MNYGPQGPKEPTGPVKPRDPFSVWGAIRGIFYLLLVVACIGVIVLLVVFGNSPKKPEKPWQEPTVASVKKDIKKMLERNYKAASDKKMSTSDRLYWELRYLELKEKE
jgi:hypothetical protein